MFKINYDQRINIYLQLSLAVIIAITLVACQIKTNKEPEIQSDILVSGCKKGECTEYIDTTNDLKVIFKCLGEMKSVSGNNIRSILLSNNNLLIYQKGSSEGFDIRKSRIPISHNLNISVSAELYNFKNNQSSIIFDDIPMDKAIEEGFYYDYIKLPDNKYLVHPNLLFDENSNSFLLLSNEKLTAYEKFIDTRKFPYKKLYDQDKIQESMLIIDWTTRYVKTLNHKYNLFIGGNYKSKEIWLEDPVNLWRSKYGKMITTQIMSAVMTSDQKVYLLTQDDIELFNPKTGEIKLIIKYEFSKVMPSMLLLNNGNLFILDSGNKKYLLLNPNNCQIICTGFIDSMSNNYLYKLVFLNNDNLLIYGLTTYIYNLKTNKVYFVRKQLIERIDPQLTVLKDNNVLILGGLLNDLRSFELFNSKESIQYNSMELLTVIFNKH